MIGIIGALKEEIDGLCDNIEGKQRITFCGTEFYLGRLYGKEIVLALSGVGKVNAAMTAASMLALFRDVDTIINIGVAGGLAVNARHGDLVLASLLIQHDFTLNSPDYKVGQIHGFDSVGFKGDESLIAIAEGVLERSKRRYIKGVVVSGDEFINSNARSAKLREDFDAIACDMESAAIAQVCAKAGTKFLSLRAVSDGGNDDADFDFLEWLPKAAKINIDFVLDFLRQQ